MNRLYMIIALLMVPSLVQAWPWSHDMANQISIKPQESSDTTQPGMRPFPKRSIPVTGTTTHVTDMAAAEKLVNPVKADRDSIARGGRLFQIYCAACHGSSGMGDGLVGAKMLLKPYDLTAAQTRARTDGFIWGYVTFGGALMPSYANDLSVPERWDVINYIRGSLQQGNQTGANGQRK